MRKIGYARVSTKHQNLARQVAALKEEGCVEIFSDQASGASLKNRPQMSRALNALEAGDVLVVAEWDRATRSAPDGYSLMSKLHKRGATIKVLDRQSLDLTTPIGRATLGLLSAIFEEERERMLRRSAHGRKLAMARGVQFGRKDRALSSEQAAEAIELVNAGHSQRSVAKDFNVSHGTINNLMKIAPL